MKITDDVIDPTPEYENEFKNPSSVSDSFVQ